MKTVRAYIERTGKAKDAPREAALPATPEEAIQLSRDLAARLASATGDEKLVLLSDLHELRDSLARRIPNLEQELAETRARLRVVRSGMQACGRYAQSADLSRGARFRRP